MYIYNISTCIYIIEQEQGLNGDLAGKPCSMDEPVLEHGFALEGIVLVHLSRRYVNSFAQNVPTRRYLEQTKAKTLGRLENTKRREDSPDEHTHPMLCSI